MQRRIQCLYMRAGTSRGPFLDMRELPADRAARDAVLLRIMGSPDAKQIDGLGGATFVTSKVVMVEPSQRQGIDVDYVFAQVIIDQPVVDCNPTCGNMMTGVGPFAIEKGWVEAKDPETTVMVYDVNADAVIETIVLTPEGQVNYCEGDLKIDGVPGLGAMVRLNLFDVAGGATGKLFPTGERVESIRGLDVSIVDAGNLMMLVKAESVGLVGTEGQTFFEENEALMTRLEAVRLEVGRRAGLGDVRESVIPKIGILSAPRNGGTIKSQYLTPHSLHPTHAVTGAICIATASKASGTVAADLAQVTAATSEEILIEHQAGLLPIHIEVSGDGDDFTVVKAGTLRTARKIMAGHVYY
jgi:4-oxalomesaconate tautomerase